ncbi:MAG: short-chain dehydrogenase [unclassified Hahellaceae]|nr:short-chain dehydrogenase [Hahellaceae bacterium]|tara:strand:+ start:6631 stop:7323 length:693 start_codon:yes stop_codon:yes gene_type:complete
MSSVLITGANRGIGLEFAKQYLEEGATVLACCRDPESADELSALARQHDALTIFKLDVTQADQIGELAASLVGTALDVLINNAGVYGPKGMDFSDINEQDWLDVLSVNSIAPFMVARALLPQLKNGKLKKIAVVSSKMGSVAENSSGGSYLYRSSKSAVNQVVKSLAHDLKDGGLRVVALHPGWVQTDMGGPQALITTEESVKGLRKVIAELDDDRSGEFFAYNGAVVPW